MLFSEHVAFCYRSQVKTVDDVSIHVDKGQILGLLGHNGAGKLYQHTTIIIPDEKVAPLIGTLIIITPLIILSRLGVFSLSTIAIITFIAGAILFSGLMTWLASFLLGKTPMYTKM